jgi:putative ABC transport system ATP-binding protein
MVVPQEPFLFSGTILDNLRFARPDAEVSECEASLMELGLGDWLEGLEQGILTPVGERGASLSAGERQLVALGRAALANPDVLILDEATSSVDALTEVRLSRALDALATGRTSIAIAHRLSTAARADRVVVLDGGRVVEDGPHQELLTSEGRYREMYEAWVVATTAESP